MDHLAVHVGEALIDAVLVKGQLLEIEPEEVEDGGVKIPDRRGVLLGPAPELPLTSRQWSHSTCPRSGAGVMRSNRHRKIGGVEKRQLGKHLNSRSTMGESWFSTPTTRILPMSGRSIGWTDVRQEPHREERPPISDTESSRGRRGVSTRR